MPRHLMDGVTVLRLDEMRVAAPINSDLLFDLDLRNPEVVDLARDAMRSVGSGRQITFIVPDDCYFEQIQASALGATDTIDSQPSVIRNWLKSERSLQMPAGQAPASIVDTGAALSAVLSEDAKHRLIDLGSLLPATLAIEDDIRSVGITNWLSDVRCHHSGTLQHCLIVTGVATAFAVQLGFSREDTRRTCLAALLHDVGKAGIPTSILDKPGRLSDEERAVIQSHPRLGFERLCSSGTLDGDILDAVLHHHELLDGSGYPDRLSAAAIRDLTRIITISDVYGALIERRSYKRELSPTAAYRAISDMASSGLLEAPLVKEFRKIIFE